jgi:hypothetical protein
MRMMPSVSATSAAESRITTTSIAHLVRREMEVNLWSAASGWDQDRRAAHQESVRIQEAVVAMSVATSSGRVVGWRQA